MIILFLLFAALCQAQTVLVVTSDAADYLLSAGGTIAAMAGKGANVYVLRITNDERIAQWVCERAGGFFIHNPKAKPHPFQLIPSTNSIVQEFADMLGVIAVAAADNQITKEEAKAIRRRWEDLKSVTEGFVRNSEEGNFTKLRDEAAHAPKPGA